MKYRRSLMSAALLTAMLTAISCGKEAVTSESLSNPPIYTENSGNNSTSKLDWGGNSNNKQPQNNGGTNNAPQMQQNGGNMPAGNNGGGNFWGNSAPNGNYGGGGSWGQPNGGTWGGVTYNQNNYYGTNSGGNSNNQSSQQDDHQEAPTAEQPTTMAAGPDDDDNGNGGTTAGENAEYTAEIVLGDVPVVKGSNVRVEGSVVTIISEGDYIFTGSTANGQICVDTESPVDKVTIVLNGVSISNCSGPAILIDEAKKCTIKVKEGTQNFLADGGSDKICDGCIFSNDTLRLKGNGELFITANNAHGISCDDDVIIDNGTYNIISVKSGIFVHDDITVNGGRVNIKGGTNGIKSKGTININGGCTMISGGSKEEKRSIYALGTFSYTGGYVYAAGNQVTVPTYSERPYIVADLGELAPAGSNVEMYLNGMQAVNFVPHNDFRSLMMLAPEITSGSSFFSVINGEASEEYTVEDGLNLFTYK